MNDLAGMIMLINKPFTTIYVAHPDYLNELCAELGDVSDVIGNLVFSPREKTDICFATDVWYQPKVVAFESISQAARLLRAENKLWFLNPLENVRRSRLIEAELKKLPPLEHAFPLTEEIPNIACFSLLDKNTLVYSNQRWKKPPLGDFRFIEDKKNPPNRAYLKLWEALSLMGTYPCASETAVDLGAAPGGWTYVMQKLGTQVTAVDKAELDPAIAKLPRVNFLKQSAFALKPEEFPGHIDWLLCDVACYPQRTYDLIMQWLATGKVRHMIFTIKLQGETDFAMLKKFQEIPGARVMHLLHNKHEVTFLYPAHSASLVIPRRT
jgi:23S rRNA (cytidine2498-2'-O)-methyltransferase